MGWTQTFKRDIETGKMSLRVTEVYSRLSHSSAGSQTIYGFRGIYDRY